MSKFATFAVVFGLGLGLSACGHTMEQRAATGALGGAAVAGPVGAAVGAAGGAAVSAVKGGN